jgi:hypothetical protein
MEVAIIYSLGLDCEPVIQDAYTFRITSMVVLS